MSNLSFKFSAIFLLAAALLSAGCSQKVDDHVLDRYARKEVSLKPVDSLSLSQYGILLQGLVTTFNDWLVIYKYRSDNHVDLIQPSTGGVIHCIKTGRGPEELISQSEMQIFDGAAYLYDSSPKKLLSLDIAKTIETGEQAVSIIKNYNSTSEVSGANLLDHVVVFDGGIMATGFFTDSKWYGLLGDNGGLLSGVDFVKTEEEFSDRALSAAYMNSPIAVSPSGDKAVCAAVCSGSISLSRISEDGQKIEEYAQFRLSEPKIKEYNQPGYPLIGYNKEEAKTAFLCVQATDELVYALYSGKAHSDPYHNMADHLLVMDWDGEPVKSYHLEYGCGNFFLDGDTLICSSMYPKPMVYKYVLK